MSTKTLLAACIGAAAFMPAIAQNAAPPPAPEGSAQEVARGYANPPMPNQEAINAGGKPGTAALNNTVAGTTGAREAANTAAVADRTAAEQAQYDVDRAAYLDALVKHDAAVDRRNARYVRQQNAYADAMWAWRRQVQACKAGHQNACNAPTPDPANFY